MVLIQPTPNPRRLIDTGANADADTHAAANTPASNSKTHSNEPLRVPFTISADLRERRAGWRFRGLRGDSKHKYRPLIVPVNFVHMKTGDYTIEGVPCLIERKEGGDFLSSISGGRANFEKEHQRMREIVEAGGRCCVIVESSLDALYDDLEIGVRNLAPSSMLGTVASWPFKYGVPIVFAGTRDLAEKLALRILWRAWEDALRAAKSKSEQPPN